MLFVLDAMWCHYAEFCLECMNTNVKHEDLNEQVGSTPNQSVVCSGVCCVCVVCVVLRVVYLRVVLRLLDPLACIGSRAIFILVHS